jgi:exodeoxyribonuclease V alpha subunit
LRTGQVRQAASQPAIERFGFTYRIGDKVMQIENNYDKEVFNGDLGFVAAIDQEEAELAIDFDGRMVIPSSLSIDLWNPRIGT